MKDFSERIKELKQYLLLKNSELLGFDGKTTSKFKFKCSKCGKIGEIQYRYHFNDKQNPNLLCKNCLKEDKYKRIKQTNMIKYGVENPLQNKEIRKKVENTNLQKYGTKYLFQNEDIKNKIKQTNLAKYGFENPSSNEEIKNKRKEKVLDKYGVNNVFQDEEVKKQIKETNLERYGVEYVSQNNEIKDKIKNTCFERYNKEFPSQSSKIQDKIKITNLQRYGTKCPLQNEKIKEKAKQACLEKYGVENISQNEEIQNKIRKTNLERYGYINPSQNELIKEKIKQTCLERYGVDSYSKTNEFKERIKETCLEKYNTVNPLQNEKIKEKLKETCLEKYGVPYSCMTDECQKAHKNKISKINLKWKELFENNNISVETEYVIDNKRYDFHILNTNILVEVNPTYTHQSSVSVFGNTKVLDKNYHLDKVDLARKNGFRCIMVWDWDDENKIINLLKSKQKLYAKKLTIKEVSSKDCDEFLNQYHLQGTCKGQDIRLGLYDSNNCLIQLMTFGKPRYNKHFQYELLRLCSHKNYIITGGAEKLFKYFIDNYSPKSVISYCDNSKFDGNVYTKLGFRLDNNIKPSIHWSNGYKHITQNLLNQLGFDRLFNTDYGKNTNNKNLMLQHNFYEVYDAGQSVYNFILS